MPQTHSGNIAITVIQQANGQYVCELTSSLESRTSPKQSFHGQNAKHAIAIALENVARAIRLEAEEEQNIDWEGVDRSSSGKIIEKRFHVILHYEHVAAEESKFDAMQNTMLGNTVVENAEMSIIQVDTDLPIEPLKRRWFP
jgi:phosphoribosylformylglycinamidine (FGAM) synthase PurS component